MVRRLRSSPEVETDLGAIIPERQLLRRAFPLSPEEEVAYRSFAELRLDLDEEVRRGRAIGLFRTTLARAVFSSPNACLETLERRIRGIDQGTARGTAEDPDRLQAQDPKVFLDPPVTVTLA